MEKIYKDNFYRFMSRPISNLDLSYSIKFLDTD